tara:strand:- start:9722 stop:17257 length:7536 start_codon:yes stop_codon:yes gene_type:complete
MPQNTNLNVSPYFDDFDADKNYQRVLFKPATPLQARELTTLQSILQNQIEKFGQHFFKEGSVVIPGQVSYDSQYTSVQIDESHLGVPISLYIENLVGKTIRGENSGVTAKVENFITKTQSDRDNFTLYLKYQSSSENDFSTNTFVDGENLVAEEDIFYGISAIREGSTFATTIIQNSTSVGSAAKIAAGVYFIRGFFVEVTPQTVILDQYDNTPSYRVGLLINEELAVASNSYNDLFDNAQGFSNFSAPGADRLKFGLTLIKKEIDDFNDENFVELIRIEEGVLQEFVKDSFYNLIRDELARRTYDESGDYYVRPFSLTVKNSLNDRIGNDGVFNETQSTKSGNTPSDDLGSLLVSPGKAVVRGYSLETIDTTIVDFDKPRTTAKAENQAIPFSVGRQIFVNNVNGSAPVGFGTTSQVSLFDTRTDSAGTSSGQKIGVARLYDLKLRNAEYQDASTQFEASLYDVQTYTVLLLNTSTNLDKSTYVEGKSSGASGFVVEDVVASNQVKLYQVSGTFKKEESLSFNGIADGRIITNIRDYSLSDVHQIVGDNYTAGLGTFTADPVLSQSTTLTEPGAQFTISADTLGVSTVTSSSPNPFVGIKTGDIVSYTKQGFTIPTFNKVTQVTASALRIGAVSDLSNINDGALPSAAITSSDFKKVSLEVLNTSNAFLYAKLNNKNVESLDLSTSSIIVRKSYKITVSANAYSATLESDIDLTLEPFDEEDYTLAFTGGTVESLNNQKVAVSGRTISLAGLSGNGDAILTVTYKKVNTTEKAKIYNRCESLVIAGSNQTSSGIGRTTLNDGLQINNYYGLRVQDKIISLNIPDVVDVLGIYESGTTSDPVLPRIHFSALNSSIGNLIKGEKIIGSNTGAVAAFVSSDGINSVEIVYLNENRFALNEEVTFQETNIVGTINAVDVGDKNIKDNFILDNGQRPEIYDYSRLIRKSQVSSPTKKIRVIYNCYSISSSSEGDFVSVDSYGRDRYGNDISTINGVRNSDMIDLRPRVTSFNPDAADKSPFEFNARLFALNANSSNSIVAKDRTINLSYNYYLPRIDKLFLTKEGTFSLNSGIPSLSPKAPNKLDSALEVATIYYPAYLYNVKDVRVSLSTHKRYTMKDISRIEDRLSNVEFYSSLSLLETDTKNLTIRDPKTGLDKFKSGFFVDNFKSYDGGDLSNPVYRASVDTAYGYLRPQHYTTAVDLVVGSEAIIGIGTTSNPDVDLRFATDLGNSNVKRINDVVMLDYTDKVFIENKFATRVENVNPFNTPSWIGSIELNPSTDTWVETRRTQRTDDVEGNFEATMTQLGVDSNTGLSPVNWNAWETNWVGVSNVEGPVLTQIQNGSRIVDTSTTTDWWSRTTTTTWEDSFTQFRNDTFTTTTEQSRQGIQFGVSERFDTVNLGDRLVSRVLITLMRSRNVEAVARRLKPVTRFFGFFDNTDVTSLMVPKLLEVRMTSGTFEEGETVTGIIPASGANRSITFRLAQQNHKYGPYNNPTEIYKENPYNTNSTLSNSYSSTSSVLNVDTASLENQADSRFFGSVAKGMQLVGANSNAVAVVSDLRLISDSAGTLISSLFIPDPTVPSNPTFETGTKTLVLTTSSTNSQIAGISDSMAEANFTSSGNIDNIENTTLRIRNAEVERNIRNDNRTLTETEDRLVANTVTTNRLETSRVRIRWSDPLAQTFQVLDNNGIFVTKCDVYFQSKDPGNVPVTLEIRTSKLGQPTQEILPFAEVSLESSEVSISDDASVATTFTFPAPVFLEGGNDYAIVLLTNSNEYNVWISRMTEVDISTSNKPEAEKIIVSQQPSLGSLFKSQNGAIWEPSQLEDLKFNLYRAEFTSQTGSFRFYNPNLGVGNRQIASLRANPIVSYAKEVLVGMSGTLTSTDVTNLIPGTSVFQQNYPNFSGKLKSIVGTVGIGSELSITNAGVGYTSDATYTNAPLKTINGNGFGGRVDLTIQGGVAVAATVSIGGTGYAMGDTLTVEPQFTGDFGKNLIISIPNEVGVITAFNSLIVTQVQDDLNTSGVSNEIAYVNPSNGISTISNGYVTYTDVLSDGLHFKVNHSNHGMYRDNNKVTLYGIESDVSPVKLTADYNQSSTANIQVSNVGIFTSFENLPVSTDNPGFIKVNQEIIKYTSADTNQNELSGITRGVDSNVRDVYPSNLVGLHPTGTPVYKYEFNGVSLRRINRTHSFSQVDLTKYPIEMDSYHLKLVTNENGKDRLFGPPKLHFFENKTGGTYDGNITATAANTLGGPKATQNVQFNSLRPNLQTLLPESTQVDAKVRTTSGTSVDGQEVSFRSSGFEPISLNSNNLFKSPRIIASRVNEITHLQQSNGYKSFEMEMNLSTTDTKVSPVIDLDRVNIMTTMNRIDKPIDNMLSDNRVNSLFDDPHSAVYVSRIIRLDRGSTGLKVYFDAYRDATNDIRVMYRLLRSDTPDNQELYEFMPGYNNIDSNGNIIDPKDNTGLPDRKVNPSSSESDLSSYEFTSKEVPLFDGFQIKIIMTGTNQAYVPRIKDLRVIATI